MLSATRSRPPAICNIPTSHPALSSLLSGSAAAPSETRETPLAAAAVSLRLLPSAAALTPVLLGASEHEPPTLSRLRGLLAQLPMPVQWSQCPRAGRAQLPATGLGSSLPATGTAHLLCPPDPPFPWLFARQKGCAHVRGTSVHTRNGVQESQNVSSSPEGQERLSSHSPQRTIARTCRRRRSPTI